MPTLNALRTLAQQEGVTVYYRSIYTSECPALGFYIPHTKTIILEQSLKRRPRKHLAVFAEELGHHFAGVNSHFRHSDKADVYKDEMNALRWAVDFLTGVI